MSEPQRENATTQNQQSSTQQMTAEDVADAVLNSRTAEEVVRAQQLLAEWLRAHPNDLQMMDAGSGLWRKAQALGIGDD